MNKGETKKIAFDAPIINYNRLHSHLVWGSMKPLFNTILSQLLDVMDKHGSHKVLSAVMSNKVNIGEMFVKGVSDESAGHRNEHNTYEQDGSTEYDS